MGFIIFTSKQENKELSALKIAQYRLCERIVSEFFWNIEKVKKTTKIMHCLLGVTQI